MPIVFGHISGYFRLQLVVSWSQVVCYRYCGDWGILALGPELSYCTPLEGFSADYLVHRLWWRTLRLQYLFRLIGWRSGRYISYEFQQFFLSTITFEEMWYTNLSWNSLFRYCKLRYLTEYRTVNIVRALHSEHLRIPQNIVSMLRWCAFTPFSFFFIGILLGSRRCISYRLYTSFAIRNCQLYSSIEEVPVWVDTLCR